MTTLVTPRLKVKFLPLRRRPIAGLALGSAAAPRAPAFGLITVDGEERWLRFYHVGSRQVWGLTARIVQNLLERLGLGP